MPTRIKQLVLRLASLGLGGKTPPLRLANVKTAMTAEHWKRKSAMAIGADPDMSDEDLDAAHDQHMQDVTDAMANEDDDMDGQVDAPPGPASEMENSAHQDIVGNLAEKTAKLMIENAVLEGRIPATAKMDWYSKFANDFEAAETALAAETKKLKTEAMTANLGGRNPQAYANAKDRKANLLALVNAKMKDGLDYDDAFLAVQSDPQNAALVSAMQQPTIKTRTK